MYAVIQRVGYSNRTFMSDGQRAPKLWLLVAFWHTQADHDAGKSQALVEDFLLTHRASPADVVADVVGIIARHGVVALGSGRAGHLYNASNHAVVPPADPKGTLARPEVAALVGRVITEADAV